MATISVLMSTYAGETAERLERSLDSVFAQTRPPDQCVVVVDGPIPVSQEAVLDRFSADRRVRDFSTLPLKSNVGLGHALRAGVDACTGDWIARMDSDDL